MQPFALTTFVGPTLLLAALASARRHPRLAALALVPAVLSLGRGPWYDLPVLEQLRFPYRWHAATLALLALLVGRLADHRGWRLLGPAIALEGLLLAPVEPVLPGASAAIPDLYARVEGPVLEVPGFVALPPGQRNPSRLRSRYLLYAQTAHGQPIPWSPDFNSVGVVASAPLVQPFRGWDPVEVQLNGLEAAPPLPADLVDRLTAAGIRHIVLHERELRGAGPTALRDALIAQGAVVSYRGGGRWLLDLPQ